MLRFHAIGDLENEGLVRSDAVRVTSVGDLTIRVLHYDQKSGVRAQPMMLARVFRTCLGIVRENFLRAVLLAVVLDKENRISMRRCRQEGQEIVKSHLALLALSAARDLRSDSNEVPLLELGHLSADLGDATDNLVPASSESQSRVQQLERQALAHPTTTGRMTCPQDPSAVCLSVVPHA